MTAALATYSQKRSMLSLGQSSGRSIMYKKVCGFRVSMSTKEHKGYMIVWSKPGTVARSKS